MNDTTRSGKREGETGTRNGRASDRVKIKIKGTWTAIPNRLLADRQLSRDARLLGALIFMHAANGSRAFPSQQLLAEELSAPVTITEKDEQTGEKRSREVERPVAIRSVQRWLIELQQAGWLEWRQTMRFNEYTLLDPHESNENQIGATVESPNNAEEQDPNATVGSPRATLQSPHMTVGSSSMIVQSPHTTVESHPSLYDSDSLDSDSSAADPPTHPVVDVAASSVPAFLADLGVVATKEFAALDLAAVQERVIQIQRNPAWRPSDIVRSLRQSPPQARAQGEDGPIDVSRYTSGDYAGLFTRGGDADEEDEETG